MTRFFRGWVPRIGGPAVKVMVNDNHDPRTHPNEDYGAFRFNSETAAIGYGDHRGTQTVVPRQLIWGPYGTWYDNYVGNQVIASAQANNADYGWLVLFANPGGIWPNLNAFYHVVKDDSSWREVWSSFFSTYSGSQDRARVSRKGSRDRYQEMIVPTKTNGAWGAAGYGYLDPASTATDVNYPPALTMDYRSLPVSSIAIDSVPTRTYSFYSLDLPVDETPYPNPPAPHPSTPASSRLVFHASPSTGARMARPGYDLNYITHPDQMVFDSNKLPMKVVRTGLISVAPSSVQGVPLGASYSPSILVDYQINRQGESLWLPPVPADTQQTINVSHRVNGSTLELYNQSSFAVDIRYVVMAADDIGASSGTAKVLESGPWGTVLRRPGSSGTSLKDTIIDSRLSYLPIVSQGWVPYDAFNNASGSGTEYGSRSHTVWWNNPGNFKPYIIAKCARQHKTNGQIVYQDLYAKRIDTYSYYSDSTFMCALHDNAAVFFASDGSRFEDAWKVSGGNRTRSSYYRTIGIRYYVFAIPVSL